MKFLTSVGFALVAYHVGYRISYPLVRQLYTPRLDLVERYGKKSWAVVTGGTDGIGKQLSRSLAKTGFNICIVARNEEKAKKTLTQLQTQAPDNQYDMVITDLNTTDIAVFKDIAKKVEEKDVSILVNNVGLLLSKRQKRSAIIDLSSIAADRYNPYLAIYGASKAYNDRLTNAINYEEQNIDMLSVRPCVTSTNMNPNAKGFFIVTPGECAEGVLNDLGKSNVSYGHWKHWLQGGLAGMLPQFVYNYISANRNKKHEGFKTK